MAEPYYKTCVETMHRLNLRGAEAQVYSALLFLCGKGPYTGSYQDLANFSCCGVDETASNTVKKLIQKGLIIKNEQGICLPNILGKEPNILGENPKILANSKEKSNKKENIKEINNNKACEYSVTEHARDDFMKIININQPPHYTYPDYYRVALECGYLNPKPLADSFRDYYNDHGWPAGRDKLRMFRTWLNNEKRFETGRKPTLTEDERLVLLTFVDKLPKRLMQHFCEQLRRLELTPEKIYFYVDKERYDNFRQWMIDINAVEILAAYNRKVYVRPA